MASSSDALSDAVLSASVLASSLIYLVTGLSLEAFVGVLISALIIKAGLELISEVVDDILGKPAEKEETDRIKAVICEEPEVNGAYDLIMFNYGPDKNYARVHIELPDAMTVAEVDKLTRLREARVYRETGVILTGVCVYSSNTSDE